MLRPVADDDNADRNLPASECLSSRMSRTVQINILRSPRTNTTVFQGRIGMQRSSPATMRRTQATLIHPRTFCPIHRSSRCSPPFRKSRRPGLLAAGSLSGSELRQPLAERDCLALVNSHDAMDTNEVTDRNGSKAVSHEPRLLEKCSVIKCIVARN